MIPLEMYIWYFVLPYVAILEAIFFSGFFWYYRNRRLPEAARLMNKCKQEGLVPSIIYHSSGRCSLKLWKERQADGVLIDDKGFRFKLLPRYRKHMKDDDGKTLEPEEEEKLAVYSDWANKRSILVELGQPIYFGATGSICMFNPAMLTLMEAGELYAETEDSNVYSPQADMTQKGWKQKLLQPLMLINLTRIISVANRLFDETQFNACITIAEQIGLLGRPSNWGKYKWLIILLVVMAVGGVAILLLPKMMGGQ